MLLQEIFSIHFLQITKMPSSNSLSTCMGNCNLSRVVFITMHANILLYRIIDMRVTRGEERNCDFHGKAPEEHAITIGLRH